MKVPPRFSSRRNVWLVLGLSGLAWEMYSLISENGASFTETTQDLWKLDTPTGKWVFLFSYGMVASWFPAHLLKNYEWDRNPALYQILLETYKGRAL